MGQTDTDELIRRVISDWCVMGPRWQQRRRGDGELQGCSVKGDGESH